MTVAPRAHPHNMAVRVENPTVFWGLVLLCTLPLLLSRIQDVDIWWHMHYGREFLKDFSFPDIASYYFTQTNPETGYLRFNFIGDVLFHGIYTLGGDAGLQLFKLLVVMGSLWLLLSCARDRYNWTTFLLSVAFVLGTYQKQLIRNSLFGLLGIAFVLWLFNRYRFRHKNRIIWLLPVTVGLWGTMHGSYLLGLALAGLLFMGDFVDGLRRLYRFSLKTAAVFAMVLVVCYGLTMIGNPANARYAGKIMRMITFEESPAQVQKEQQLIYLADEEATPFSRIKNFLNNTMFRIPPGAYKSADFASPFDRLNLFFVPICLGFAGLGLVLLLFFIRPIRMSLLLVFLGMTLLGLGYLRTVGYIPVIVLFIYCTAAGAGELRFPTALKRLKLSQWTGPALCLLWVFLLWTITITGHLVPLSGVASHVFGFGRLPMFDAAMGSHVLSRYADRDVFTPIDTGGYYLLTWYPEKKVFMAGLFSVHPKGMFEDYKRIMHEGEIDLVHGKYGLTVAVIPHHKQRVKELFFRHRDWAVAAISNGNILFERQAGVQVKLDVVTLMEPEGLAFRNDRLKRTIASSFYALLAERINSGRSDEAARLVAENRGAFDILRQSAPELFNQLGQYL